MAIKTKEYFIVFISVKKTWNTGGFMQGIYLIMAADNFLCYIWCRSIV